MSESVRLDTAGGIARLTMSRPEVHNAFDDALIARCPGAVHPVAAADIPRKRAQYQEHEIVVRVWIEQKRPPPLSSGQRIFRTQR